MLYTQTMIDPFHHIEMTQPHLRRGVDGSLPWSIGHLAQSRWPNLARRMLALQCREPRWSIGLSTSSSLTLHVLLRDVAVGSPTGHDCVICQDPIHGAEVRAPCGHYYGIDCVTDLFQSATRDETLFPPRCCRQNIPFAQVQPHLTQTLITTFQQKVAEFSTLKRVYCSSPACSRFLGPLSEGFFASKSYTCPAPGCGRRTCAKCREQYSGDWTHVCRPDADADQILELSRASGWARCPGCSQMIELNMGCFHMTCRCRTEFCYLCRAQWKSCPCPQWDERRLLAAAEERVDAQLGVGLERGARRDVPAQRAGPVPAPVPANQAPVVRLGARPVVPVRAPVPAHRPVPPPVPARPLVPAPAPARRPEPAPAPVRFFVPPPAPVPAQRPVRPLASAPAPVPAQRPAPAQPLAPARLRAVETLYPPSIPARTPTTSNSTGRPENTTSTRPREGASHRVESWRSTLPSSVFAPTRTPTNTTTASTSTSTPCTVRPKSTHNSDPMRQRLVHEMMERLRVDHDCDHTRWRYRHGGGICQTCGHHLPIYLYVSGRAVVRASRGLLTMSVFFSVARVVKCWRASGASITVCETRSRQRFEMEWHGAYAFRSAPFLRACVILRENFRSPS